MTVTRGGGAWAALDPALAACLPPGDRAAAVDDPVAERDRRRAGQDDGRAALGPWLRDLTVTDVVIDRAGAGAAEAMLARLEGTAPAGAVPIRLYRPRDGRVDSAVLYLHGGAFVFGDIADSGRQCAEISGSTRSLVAMVDYRLAPEHPYPAALADCALALAWLARGADGAAPGGRVAVMGSSAGGNLAAALTLLARDSDVDVIGLQALLSPALDPRLDSGSMTSFGATPGWNGAASRAMWRQYLQGRPPDQARYAAPALAGALGGLPPALVVTAQCDPLRDEAIGYAQLLMAEGTTVELYNAPGAFHGFLAAAPDAEVSRRVMSLMTAALLRWCGPPPAGRGSTA